MDYETVLVTSGETASDNRKVGDRLSNVTLHDETFKEVKLLDFEGEILLIGVETSVYIKKCIEDIKRFDVEGYIMSDDVAVSVITSDIPFSLSRFSFDNDITNVALLSDSITHKFGKHSGFELRDLPLLTRGVIVVDRSGVIKHVQYVTSYSDEIDYIEAIRVIKENLK